MREGTHTHSRPSEREKEHEGRDQINRRRFVQNSALEKKKKRKKKTTQRADLCACIVCWGKGTKGTEGHAKTKVKHLKANVYKHLASTKRFR